jgi:hypothetical protein
LRVGRDLPNCAADVMPSASSPCFIDAIEPRPIDSDLPNYELSVSRSSRSWRRTSDKQPIAVNLADRRREAVAELRVMLWPDNAVAISCASFFAHSACAIA